MEKRIYPSPIADVAMPERIQRRDHTDPAAAVRALAEIYDRNTTFLRDAFETVATTGRVPAACSDDCGFAISGPRVCWYIFRPG